MDEKRKFLVEVADELAGGIPQYARDVILKGWPDELVDKVYDYVKKATDGYDSYKEAALDAIEVFPFCVAHIKKANHLQFDCEHCEFRSDCGGAYNPS